MARQLASIQRIKKITPIVGAASIEVADILGWKVVVKKNDFAENDLVVYCEIDCLMPDKPEFEFLKPRSMRIKTVRLRGQVSQGICFPLSILPDGFEIKEDADCTEALGIIKYEPPVPAHLSGIAKGRFPGFIARTDETRVQVLQKVLDIYKGEKCYVTEKIDGSSVTFFINNGEFGVCTRNLELLEDAENTFWKFARATDLETKMRALNRNFAIQGECVGENIQKNKLKLKGQTILFFNVFDIDKREYLEYERFVEMIKRLELQTVPVITTDYELSNNIDDIVKIATRKSILAPDVWAEGIVIRPLVEKSDALLLNENINNGRVSFKAVNPEFLLKYGE